MTSSRKGAFNPLLASVVIGLVFVGLLAYVAFRNSDGNKIDVNNTPKSVDWSALMPEMRSALEASYRGPLDRDPSIIRTEDLTGDGVAEAVVTSGTGGAYTTGIAVFRAENGHAVLAKVKTQDGEVRNADIFAEGASAMHGISFGTIPEKNVIWGGTYAVDGSSTDGKLESCEVGAHVWNESARQFQWNSALSGEVQKYFCDEAKFRAGGDAPEYRNPQYGFYFRLPAGWQGYRVEESAWQGYRPQDEAQAELVTGPIITLKDTRAATTTGDSWQDIPVMIYTLEQWNKGPISQAAPVAPSELGRNNKYVFILPARSIGFRDTLGVQEVWNWLEAKQFKTSDL